jgi:hypothetical protein
MGLGGMRSFPVGIVDGTAYHSSYNVGYFAHLWISVEAFHETAIAETHSPEAVLPEIVAFKQAAEEALRKHYRRLGLPRPLLMLGAYGSDLSSALIADPVLEPVDKIVAAVLMMLARKPGHEPPLFPSQPQIARLANVAAKDTIWRALLILRCTRWLTVFESETYQSVRMRSIGFAINARSMPVADTLYVDPYYISFLEKAAGHAHARVRMIAGDNLRQLPEVSVPDRRYYPADDAS